MGGRVSPAPAGTLQTNILHIYTHFMEPNPSHFEARLRVIGSHLKLPGILWYVRRKYCLWFIGTGTDTVQILTPTNLKFGMRIYNKMITSAAKDLDNKSG